MKLLVIGGGGREHALAWKLFQSPRVHHVFVAPGNAGTAHEEGLENIPLTAIPDLIQFAQEENITFTVVGPEAPLAEGIVDAFKAANLKIFGPTQKAAQLEISKTFAKEFMQRHKIPTADFASFKNAELAHRYIDKIGAPIVIKADGLAAGKGVIVAQSAKMAHDAVDMFLVDKQYGSAGSEIIIEKFLEGIEISFIVMTDGKHVLPLATSQDHKRLSNGDLGPNTGGMGAYSPTPFITPELHAKILREVINPVIQGMKQENSNYTGFLYAGLIITPNDQDIKVLEFNCRMGDPETQPIMLRLKSDLSILIEHALNGTLNKVEADWDHRTALGIIMAAQGYPEQPRKGDVIHGLLNLHNQQQSDNYHIFHSGTAFGGLDDKEIITSGGRVLCITALGDNINLAQQHAYSLANQISFNGSQMRDDIGYHSINYHQK
ncbi:MAG: phosphoribosylamine--glycine ligase [Nitrosomonas sp.]|nr:phosphoribosylamine--glycine ligase [Nitrosomonas sp.]